MVNRSSFRRGPSAAFSCPKLATLIASLYSPVAGRAFSGKRLTRSWKLFIFSILQTLLGGGKSFCFRAVSSFFLPNPSCLPTAQALGEDRGSCRSCDVLGRVTRSARRPGQRARALRQPARWVSGRRLWDQS